MRLNRYVLISLFLIFSPFTVAQEIYIPSAPTLEDFAFPAPEGPYPIGVRAFSWIDRSREEIMTPIEDDYREVTVQIWYPAFNDPDSPKALYTPELETILLAGQDLPQSEREFINMHVVMRGAVTNSVPGSDIAESTQLWPVILFSPGGNVSRHWQTALAERIASQGFVLISISHPYSTIDVAPNTGFSMSADWGLDQEDEQAVLAADNKLADILTADAIFALDKLEELSLSDPFFQSMNFEKVGLAGHSRGGTTVGHGCAIEPRFKACVVLDNIGPEREQTTGVPAPMMVLRSPWEQERIMILHEYLGRTGSIAFDVELKNSNHFSCTDLPFFMEDLRVDNVEPIEGINTCAKIVTEFFVNFLGSNLANSTLWTENIESEQIHIITFD